MRLRVPPPGSAPLDVVGLGEVSLDDVLLLEAGTALGGKARLRGRERVGGGQVATAMVAVRRLGLRSALAGAVGDDAAGSQVLADLRDEEVEVTAVRTIGGARTRCAVVLVASDGTRTVLADEDPALTLRPDGALRAAMARGRAVHVDGTFPEAALAAASDGRAGGRLVSCDLDEPQAWHGALLPLVDVCVVPAGYREPGAPPPRLAAGGVFVETRGAAGALARDATGWSAESGAFAVVPVRDTTACGDTFRAGLLVALLDGMEVEAALRFAAAAAALKVRDVGRRGCPRRAELDAWLAHHG